ncbi:MAG: class I SAM-dependent methyltransferase [Thermodesulfovibrionales bacterium]
MTGIFDDYARFYDLLYGEKEYAGECDYIENLFKRYSPVAVRSLLDMGCGTGGHALLFAERGFNVVGVDLSERMLETAREKAMDRQLNVEFFKADIRHLKLDRQFDAVISMFAVMGYQTTNDDLLDALGSARRQVSDGGLFIFDCWHGPGVLSDRPSERLKKLESPTHTVYRFARPVLHADQNRVDVHYTLISIDKTTNIATETVEVHRMRYLFIQELELLAGMKGFTLLAVHPFMGMAEGVSEKDWNVTFVLQAV